MTAWFDGVSFAVEVAFLSDPLAESPTWTDITDYVRSIDTDTGRTSEYSEYSPGSLSLVLSNNDRRFDPEYTSGAYVGTPLLDEDDAVILTEDGEWIGTDTTVYLLPMKRIRVQATYSATTYPLFDGFILGWPQFIIGMTDETVRVSAVDGFRFLENSTLQRSAYEAAVLADSPHAYWPLQESSILSYDDVIAGADLQPSLATLVQSTTQASTPIGAVTMTGVDATTVDPAQGGALLNAAISDAGTLDASCVEMWMSYSSPLSVTNIVRCSTRDENESYLALSDYLGFLELDYTSVADSVYCDSAVTTVALSRDQPYHLAVRATTTTIYVYVNGVQEWSQALTAGTTSFGANDAPFVDVGVTLSSAGASNWISHLAIYAGTPPSAARFTEHYLAGVTAYGHPYGERSGARIERVLDEIGWPDALRDISTGDTVHGPYLPNRQSALAYVRQVAAGEDGLLFISPDGKVTLRDRSWQWAQATSGTFSDDGAGLGYSDIVIDANSVDAIRNQVAVSFRSADGYVRVEDAASVTAYGPSSDAVDAATVDSSAIARALAGYRLRTRSDPRLLISELEVKPRAAPSTMYPVVMDVKIGDVVTVERTPAGVGSQIVKKLTIQGYSHEINIDNWVTKYYLAPAPTSGADAPYLLVNTSGSTSLIGAASGNLIPF